MKKIIRDVFRKFGLEVQFINKSTDEDLYRKLYPIDSLSNLRFYNIGAGDFQHPCWTNVDGKSEWYQNYFDVNKIGIVVDLFAHEQFPIGDNTAELVYTSHTIEHIDDHSVQFLLDDTYRFLKKDGVIRIVTVNSDTAFNAWQRKDRNYFFWSEWESQNTNYESNGINIPLREASLAQLFLSDFASAATTISLVGNEKRIDDAELERLFRELPYEEALNYCTSLCSIEIQKKYPYFHMNWFNEKKLTQMLKQAGFKTVRRSAYLQSEVPVLRNQKYFDSTLPQISIYMEAVK